MATGNYNIKDMTRLLSVDSTGGIATGDMGSKMGPSGAYSLR